MTPEKEAPCDRAYLERVIEERNNIYEARFRALKELVDERDRLYDTRFKSAETAVSTALAAQEKLVNSSFAASEKAIVKAEQAQKEYNERSNEFRGQLDDQAKTLMPRPETLNMFKALEEKVSGIGMVMDNKISNVQSNSKNEMEAAKLALEKSIDTIAGEVNGLRESRSGSVAKDLAQHDFVGQRNQNLVIIITFIGLVATIIALIFKH